DLLMLRGADRQQEQRATPRVACDGKLAVNREALGTLRECPEFAGVDEAATRRTGERRRRQLGGAAAAAERFGHAEVGGLTRYGPVTSSGISAVIRHAWRKPNPMINALISPWGIE